MKATLQLALEALENFKGCLPEHWETFDEKAITAIKEALAQPEEAQSALSLFQSGFIDGREKGLKEALAQRTWVGLTDEDVENLCLSVGAEPIEVRLIEAKLKEKNT